MTGFAIETALEVESLGRRYSAAFGSAAYVEVVASRPDLSVITGSRITKVELMVPLADQPAIGDRITVAAELAHAPYQPAGPDYIDPDPGRGEHDGEPEA